MNRNKLSSWESQHSVTFEPSFQILPPVSPYRQLLPITTVFCSNFTKRPGQNSNLGVHRIQLKPTSSCFPNPLGRRGHVQLEKINQLLANRIQPQKATKKQSLAWAARRSNDEGPCQERIWNQYRRVPGGHFFNISVPPLTPAQHVFLVQRNTEYSIQRVISRPHEPRERFTTTRFAHSAVVDVRETGEHGYG